jgi:translation initiation factor IF-2
MPVEISGFNGIVTAGDKFIVVQNENKAQELIDYRMQKEIAQEPKDTMQSILDILQNDIHEVKVLGLIIKADTQGSLEAIIGSLKKITHKDIEIKIIHSNVGEINESDIMLSKTGTSVILGFNARANPKARDLARKDGIEIRYHSIIYNLIDDIKMILTGLLDPDIVENIIGYAEIREVFNVRKVGKVAGCFVKEGILRKSSYVRVLRDNIVIHDGVLAQLKRFKDDVKEVKQDYECGVTFDHYNDIKEGDFIECYEKLEVRNNIE